MSDVFQQSADPLIWGVVLHLTVDWLLQNEWIAVNKVKLWPMVDNPAGWIHAGMHGLIQWLIFPWWAALVIGVTHLLIDTRKPVEWWSRQIKQTQPNPEKTVTGCVNPRLDPRRDAYPVHTVVPTFDIGTDVSIWTDQVFHIVVIAIVAVIVHA